MQVVRRTSRRLANKDPYELVVPYAIFRADPPANPAEEEEDGDEDGVAEVRPAALPQPGPVEDMLWAHEMERGEGDDTITIQSWNATMCSTSVSTRCTWGMGKGCGLACPTLPS